MSEVTAELLETMPLPDPDQAEDKDSRGRGLIVASSNKVPGAAKLSGEAFLRAGAGKVQLAVPGVLAIEMGVAFPESGVIALRGAPCLSADLREAIEQADCTLIGPGITDREGTTRFIDEVFAQRWQCGFVLDAIALHDLWERRAAIRQSGNQLIVTPHHGEMAAMLGLSKEEVSREAAALSSQVAKELGAVVVLKSETTYVASPGGSRWEHSNGCIGLATAGSGDVLAGVVAGLFARGSDPASSALWAVAAHAQAGRILTGRYGKVGFLARELIPTIPVALAALRNK